MGRSVGVRFWPELPLMIRAANGGCEPIPEVLLRKRSQVQQFGRQNC